MSVGVQNHIIGYSGDITVIPASSVPSRTAKDDPAVAQRFAAQLGRITHIDYKYAIPEIGGGLIVSCTAKDAEKIYDAVFGLADVKPAAQKLNSTLADKFLGSFTKASLGPVETKTIRPAFGNASGAEIIRPDFDRNVAPEMRLAA